jgi:ISTde2, transposase
VLYAPRRPYFFESEGTGMKGYKHLTEFDRNKIARMRKEGATMREIGAALHVSAATVCREIKRGTYTYMNADYIEVTEYIPERSQARYRANMAAKGGPLKIGSDRRYAETLEALIADDNYSPEAALHEIEDHPEKYGSFETRICRQTLYAYIDKGVFLRLTNKALPFKGSRRKKKTKHVQRAKQQPKGESIEKRPPEIDGRQEFGHWEMDLVVSCRGGHKCLLVLTERVTRMEVIRLIRDKSAASVVRALDTMERKWGARFPQVFQSITMDNGSEFADYIGIERSVYKRCESKRTRTYYCHPYCSSERGSNEKQNQMIRRKFPKGTNFDKVTQKDVEAVESWLNRYPRQLLGWASAGQLFEGYLQTV